MTREPGQKIDRWIIDKKLGSGGMGEVYLCHAEDDPNVRAAVKTLRVGTSADNTSRFRTEAEVLKDMDHAFVCGFLGYGEDPYYLAMEFIEGETLLERIKRRGKLSPASALEIVREVTEALSYVHARNVWHRDIKPDNVMIRPDGWVKLVDFGIAIQEGQTRLTQEGHIAGTLPYIPPEAMTADDPDPQRWDLYGVGATLYEAITGEVPFQPKTKDGRVNAIKAWKEKMECPFLDPGEEFDDKLRALVRDLTALEPKDRLASAGAVGRRLQELQVRMTQELPQMKRPPGSGVTPAPMPKRDFQAAPAPQSVAQGAALGAVGGAGITAALIALIGLGAAVAWSPSRCASSSR